MCGIGSAVTVTIIGITLFSLLGVGSKTKVKYIKSKPKEREATTKLGAINRGQQAFHIERNRFAENIDEPVIKNVFDGNTVSDSNGILNNYDYQIRPISQHQTQIIAIPKINNLRSYTSGIFFTTSNSYHTVICGFYEPTQKDLPSPQFINGKPQCPEGSGQLKI